MSSQNSEETELQFVLYNWSFDYEKPSYVWRHPDGHEVQADYDDISKELHIQLRYSNGHVEDFSQVKVFEQTVEAIRRTVSDTLSTKC